MTVASKNSSLSERFPRGAGGGYFHSDLQKVDIHPRCIFSRRAFLRATPALLVSPVPLQGVRHCTGSVRGRTGGSPSDGCSALVPRRRGAEGCLRGAFLSVSGVSRASGLSLLYGGALTWLPERSHASSFAQTAHLALVLVARSMGSST